jgi:hypothetical protein
MIHVTKQFGVSDVAVGCWDRTPTNLLSEMNRRSRNEPSTGEFPWRRYYAIRTQEEEPMRKFVLILAAAAGVGLIAPVVSSHAEDAVVIKKRHHDRDWEHHHHKKVVVIKHRHDHD